MTQAWPWPILSQGQIGSYVCLNGENVYEVIVLNMQQMVKVIKPFCWDQNFVHIGLSAPALGLYTH